MEQLDFAEILVRLLKYLIEGIIVGFVAYFVSKKLTWQEVVIIGITAALVFLLLDTYSPSIGSAARLGTGLGIGTRLVGLNVAGTGLI